MPGAAGGSCWPRGGTAELGMLPRLLGKGGLGDFSCFFSPQFSLSLLIPELQHPEVPVQGWDSCLESAGCRWKRSHHGPIKSTPIPCPAPGFPLTPGPSEPPKIPTRNP